MISKLSIGLAYAEAAAFLRREKRLIAPVVLALLVVPVSVAQLIQPLDPLAATDGVQPWMPIALAALLVQLAGQMAIARLAMGWTGSLGGAIGLAVRRLPAAIAALVIFFVALGVVLVPIIMVLMAGGARGATGAALVNSVSLLALIAAGPRVLMVPTLAMADAGGPWTLVRNSWRLSRGRFWRLLGFFLLFLLASLILALAVSAVVGTVAALAFGPPEPLSVSRLLLALAGGIVQGGAATLYAAMAGRMLVQMMAGSSNGT